MAAVASNPGSKLKVAAMEVVRGEEVIRTMFEFDTGDAREIQQRVEEHKLALNHAGHKDHARVLMVFTRPDIGKVPLGKRSGENAIIESISPKPRPIIYGSELAEQRIKSEMADSNDNVFKKGFQVDVNVEMRNGKPIAYNVTHVHAVVERR